MRFTSFSEALTALVEIGGRIDYDGEQVMIDAPENCLTPELMAALREHKGAFLHLVRMPPPEPVNATPSESWDEETRMLVEWYATVRERLPAAPFRLARWSVVTDSVGFRASLDRVIAQGPSAGRAPLATLRTHLAALRVILSDEHRRAA